jgi:hemin uptake protein HemP
LRITRIIVWRPSVAPASLLSWPLRRHTVTTVVNEPFGRPSIRSSTDWVDAPTHRAISSDDLMAGERVIIIRHGKEEYRLRITASDKLILTK